MNKTFPYMRITADDWGMSPAVNEGILLLVEKGIVRRVSMLVDAPFFDFKLAELLNHKVDFGLHFDLTLQNRKNTANPFTKETLLKYLFDLRISPAKKVEALKDECVRQLLVLKKHNVPVTYLDGHQHVHLLPFVSEGVALAMVEQGIKAVRNPYSRKLWLTQKFPINFLSVIGIRSFTKKGITYTTCHYPQKSHHYNAATLDAFLKRSPESEFIVHPASKNDFQEVGCDDPYREDRVSEFNNLLGLKELSQ